MELLSASIIDELTECFELSERVLPSLEEIKDFEDFMIEANHLTFREDPSDAVNKCAYDFRSSEINYDIPNFEHNDETLATYRTQIEQMIKQISNLDSEYKNLLEEKVILQVKNEELKTDRDTILAYKLGTLSHFCYSKKIKFGFLVDKKGMGYKTIPCNSSSNLPEELECRWNILRSFINPENKN